jgi:hypothetical protein
MKKQLLTSLMLLNVVCVLSQELSISYPATHGIASFSGRIVVYFSKWEKSPRQSSNWARREPMIACDVKNLKPNEEVVVSDKNSLGYPVKLSSLERGDYIVEAVFDRNSTGERAIGETAGNFYSKPTKVTLDEARRVRLKISCDSIIEEKKFNSGTYTHELKVNAKRLSSFYNRPTDVKAAIHLPASYLTDSTRRYPIFIYIDGFGGDYRSWSTADFAAPALDSIEYIAVFPDANCPNGHCVFANSDNNGDWGDAFVYDFLPELDRTYRTNGARYLNGHSSGGWSVLWLQMKYPDSFDGCWSSSPDPVDFRSFQGVDLYQPNANFYMDSTGSYFPSLMIGGFATVFYLKEDWQREQVLNRGEQMVSFESVFSGRRRDGTINPICDRQTGAINPSAVEEWKRYDISLYLRENWTTLKSKLDGKIYITMGRADNFVLQNAVALLKKEMKTLKADMPIDLLSGDHFTVLTREVNDKGFAFLGKRYRQWLKKNVR